MAPITQHDLDLIAKANQYGRLHYEMIEPLIDQAETEEGRLLLLEIYGDCYDLFQDLIA